MKVIVRKSRIMGSVAAPPSKSCSHRAIICAALAKGKSIIHDCLISDDVEATIDACSLLGATIKRKGNRLLVKGTTTVRAPIRPINCRKSGSTIRFLAPIAALAKSTVTLTGEGRLLKRPMGPVVKALEQLGVACKSNEGYPPLIIKGPLKGGKVEIAGDVSSQFISGLLFALPLAKGDSEIIITKRLESRPYVEITLHALKQFGIKAKTSPDLKHIVIQGNQGYKAREYCIEGDFSSAAFLLAAGALGGSVEVSNLKMDSKQGDREIVEILKKMGARMSAKKGGVKIGRGRLSAVDINAGDIPDLVPILAVLATQAHGETRIAGAARLRTKESDRLSAISAELRKMGARISKLRGGLVIKGPTKLKGAIIDPHDDHRIAMACSVAGLIAEGETTIENPECVNKSYPLFFQDVRAIGADVMTVSNTLGKNLMITTIGESHGKRIGVIVDGCPSGVPVHLREIQAEVDRRRSRGGLTTGRREKDRVILISGIKKKRTTGEPIRMEIENKDVNSRVYEEMRNKPRPGHADYTARMKYKGLHDYRGGGIFSGRMTACYVMAGAIAKKLLALKGIKTLAHVVQVGKVKIDREISDEEIERNVYSSGVRCADPVIAKKMKVEILRAKEEGDSIGGVIEDRILGVPVGIGEPLFDSVESVLSHGMFSIPAVKGIEFGAGFRAAEMRGSEHNDPFTIRGGRVITSTNNAGGILGGLSNGMPIIFRVVVKPTSSIAKRQKTADLDQMKPAEIQVKGRHDPCIAIRAVPVVEAMAAICMADLLLEGEK